MVRKELVLNHLREYGYTAEAIQLIADFLTLKKVKERNEVIKIKLGEGKLKDFLVWFEGANEKEEEESKMRDEFLKFFLDEFSDEKLKSKEESEEKESFDLDIESHTRLILFRLLVEATFKDEKNKDVIAFKEDLIEQLNFMLGDNEEE